MTLIKPNPGQPRSHFDPEALAALAESIAASGVVQPLLVRPLPDGSYELVAGERRWRAAQQAGLDKVPAVVRDQAEAERMQAALIENMVREDLNPVEEARACSALVEDLGLTKEELARRVGRSRPAVSNLIRLLELPDEALDMLQAGKLSEGHGKALLAANGNDVRRRLARDAFNGGWSVRETEKRVRLASQPRTRPRRAPVTPDEQAALEDAADALEAAFGYEVKLRPERHRPGRRAAIRGPRAGSRAGPRPAPPQGLRGRGGPPAGAARSAPAAVAIIACRGRLAQLVRARL